MRLIQTRCKMMMLIGMLLLSACYADAGPQKEKLPRSIGPLTLGMTEEAFKKITGVTPNFCHWCALDELTAPIDADKYPGLFPKLSKGGQGFDCGFYKKKLYKIETSSSEMKQIDAAKKHYTALYGPPSKVEDWPNGVSWLTWENKTTAFVLAYNREKSGTFPYTMPPGTVTLVQYIDKPLRDALEAQEKKNPTRQHH